MENKIVENIKKDYEIKNEKDINKLKKLDRKAKLPSIIFGYTFLFILLWILLTLRDIRKELRGKINDRKL